LETSTDLPIKEDDQYADGVLLAYILNPFAILSFSGQTTTVFANLRTTAGIFRR